MIQLTPGKSFGPGEVITHSALKEYEMKLYLSDIFNLEKFKVLFLKLSAFIYSFPFISFTAVYVVPPPTQTRGLITLCYIL